MRKTVWWRGRDCNSGKELWRLGMCLREGHCGGHGYVAGMSSIWMFDAVTLHVDAGCQAKHASVVDWWNQDTSRRIQG